MLNISIRINVFKFYIDQGEELDDDMSCKKCNKSDQPEWILLCDTCNQGWHASCLRPALMAIPDGDWYCPLCRHVTTFFIIFLSVIRLSWFKIILILKYILL